MENWLSSRHFHSLFFNQTFWLNSAIVVVATLVMFVGGLFALVIKVLPWLVLAVIAVWLHRAFFGGSEARARRKLRRKINRLDRKSWR